MVYSNLKVDDVVLLDTGWRPKYFWQPGRVVNICVQEDTVVYKRVYEKPKMARCSNAHIKSCGAQNSAQPNVAHYLTEEKDTPRARKEFGA